MTGKREETLETGATTLTVTTTGDTQVGLTGSFGTVTITDPNGATIRTAETAASAFHNTAVETVFTLTVGAGPVVVAVYPIGETAISKFHLGA